MPIPPLSGARKSSGCSSRIRRINIRASSSPHSPSRLVSSRCGPWCSWARLAGPWPRGPRWRFRGRLWLRKPSRPSPSPSREGREDGSHDGRCLGRSPRPVSCHGLAVFLCLRGRDTAGFLPRCGALHCTTRLSSPATTSVTISNRSSVSTDPARTTASMSVNRHSSHPVTVPLESRYTAARTHRGWSAPLSDGQPVTRKCRPSAIFSALNCMPS
mmetsp:Transcript_33910/g.97696  ORF Transcript_33910/g.97696 Transcript_33910/m.97696 type:complete len:215 (-) Transcript_33910:221-865(-)